MESSQCDIVPFPPLYYTWSRASTMVTVFPVPGGPNTMYGAGREVPFTMLVTASCCSLLDSIFASKNLFYMYTNMQIFQINYRSTEKLFKFDISIHTSCWVGGSTQSGCRYCWGWGTVDTPVPPPRPVHRRGTEASGAGGYIQSAR